MRDKLRTWTLVAGMAALVCPLATQAQTEEKSKFDVQGSIDLVSNYIWRGADQNSGVSVQPSLTLSYGNLSLNAWGNQSLTKWEEGGALEVDFSLSYQIKNFSISVYDYWWEGVDQPYGHYPKGHHFEGELAYEFGEKFPLRLAWSTMFAGADKEVYGEDSYDKNRYSTYIHASYPISLPSGVTLTPSVGFTPWKGMYYHKAAFTDVALTAAKDVKFTENFSLPLFLQVVTAPVYDRTYVVGGFSIGF